MEAGRPRRSEVGDWATRAQSIGEWPGDSFTCLEGLVGMEEWVGGGARVEVPGARLGTGRERFGEGMLVGAGARVGMRRACATGTGGGAMAVGEGAVVEEDAGARGGNGGGGIRSDAAGGLVVVVGEGEVAAEGVVADRLGGADGRGSDREKLGTEGAMPGLLGAAFGVAWPSSSPSQWASS